MAPNHSTPTGSGRVPKKLYVSFASGRADIRDSGVTDPFQTPGHLPGETTAAYISLGSNQGRKTQNLDQAVHCLGQESGIVPGTLSQVYYTEPQGVKAQPWFVNQVLELFCSSDWEPRSFVRRLLAIETRLGRIRSERWGPRVIDLDLLLWGETVSHSPEATVPHPRMAERAFVLVPLLEIRPDIRLPGGRPVRELCDRLDYTLVRNTISQP